MNTEILKIKDIIMDHYKNEYIALNNSFPSDPDLKNKRDKAIELFLSRGFPSMKEEDWRFTNISPITRTKFITPKTEYSGENLESLIQKVSINIPSSRLIVFINGHHIPVHSNKREAYKLLSIKKASAENDKYFLQNFAKITDNKTSSLIALNTGLFSDGIFLQIPDNTIIEEPFYLLFINKTLDEQFGIFPRNLITVGKNSKISIIEHFVSIEKSVYFTNVVTELFIGENSEVEHTKLELESVNAYHYNSLLVQQKQGSNLTQHSIMIGGSIVRNEISTQLCEEEIKCTLNGLSLASGKQLIDNHTEIDHTKPRCESHQLYKTILDGSSKGVFNGKIFVRKDAQKTDAKQTNKTLLLSDNATMNTKPQLEIFTDDVKCTHGAAIGYLDSEAMFYLRSRGIAENIARDLLTYAFANDIVSRIKIEPVHGYLNHLIYTRLKQGRELAILEG